MLSFIFTEDSFIVDRSVEAGTGSEAEQKLGQHFISDKYKTLLEVGLSPASGGESPSFAFLKRLSGYFIKAVQNNPDLEVLRDKVQIELSEENYEELEMTIPFGIGTENISRAWIALQVMKLSSVFTAGLRDYQGTAGMYLTELNQNLRVPERIFFHLVENTRDDTGRPFAFLATYATKDGEGGVKHVPLSYALEEYKHDRDKLLGLLACLGRTAEVSPLIAAFVDSGEMFHPLRMTAEEAYEFLKAVPKIEECGVVCRLPNWWKRGQSSISMQVKLGEDKPALLGAESIVSMVPELTVDGVPLTESDIKSLLDQTEGLALLKGKWVEVNHSRLERMLGDLEKYRGDMSLLEALKFEAGLSSDKIDIDIGPVVTNGKWLGTLLGNLKKPQNIKNEKVPKTVKADLRSYQETGFRWLCYMNNINFGACLADDMGLGKTLQIITFLSWVYKKDKNAVALLIVPASLLGNWEKEVEKFAPDLPFRIMHGEKAEVMEKQYLDDPSFINVTTYGMALRMEGLSKRKADYLILDEAQAIKNPATKQTRAIKKIPAVHKIAMTGTPIENDLTNLWSLFDFLNKGLLGTSDEFRKFTKELPQHSEGYGKLKNIISPFLLRRLKSDKKIIKDLPDKVEKIDYVNLSPKQIVLYRKQVADLEKALASVDGMKRRGLVLATLTKLKQICNHPDQFLGQERFSPKDSGKFEVMRALCETIYSRRERVLIFTQYKEIIPYLENFLTEIFECKGLVIHGGVPVSRRQKLVDQFNAETYVPYMILSLKAGGTGLNLTAANHVIHFDRWWNPAVENQATDRAYRIGQNKSVIVHKFVTVGTIEERIDKMITDKVSLAESVVGTGENWITEMSDSELLNLMRLEI